MTRIALATLLLAVAVMFSGCIFDEGNENDLKQYLGFGAWPQYAGIWRSDLATADSRAAGWAYLDIVVAVDGTFSGYYAGYRYSETGTTAGMYVPGSERRITGALNFTTGSGLASFENRGEVSFTLQVSTANELAMAFSAGFAYSAADVRRMAY